MSPPDEPIDWTALAREVGALSASGERGGDHHARAALNALLGSQQIKLAVAHYLDLNPGFELVRSVLSWLRPRAAMHECYRVYRDSEDVHRRRSAVELLRVVAEREALVWIEEFLADDDEDIQAWGIGVLDQLVTRDLVDDDDAAVEQILRRADEHPSGPIRETAGFIRGMFAPRAAPA